MSSAASVTLDTIEKAWESSVVKTLSEFITIPNVSPGYDPECLTNGLQEKAVECLTNWAKSRPVKGMTLEVVALPGRTPVIFAEIAPSAPTAETVLMYGHFDKQPPLTEAWRDGLHPYKPVLEGTRLYGRGGADDGYAIFAALTAIEGLQAAGRDHARIVLIIEGCEESGSKDLPAYVDHLGDRIGTPSLVVCLDSGCANYEQLWTTTNLRGVINGVLSVQIVSEGLHSGLASGIVPDTFRIATALIHKNLCDTFTGEVTRKLHVEVPPSRIAEAEASAVTVGDGVWSEFPFVPGAGPMGENNVERILNRTWRPTLTVTGADGLPPISAAGNVLRTHTNLMLSIRCPPTLDADAAAKAVEDMFNNGGADYGAKVSFKLKQAASGWNAPPTAPWLDASLQAASQKVFGKPSICLGEGGTIPFMGMLGKKFPAAQFMITGVLGPASNAHGPNEFIDVVFARKVTQCVAEVLSDHHGVFCKAA